MCWCLVMYLYFLDMTLVWYVQQSHFSPISLPTNCFVSFRSPHIFLRFEPLCCTQQFSCFVTFLRRFRSDRRRFWAFDVLRITSVKSVWMYLLREAYIFASFEHSLMNYAFSSFIYSQDGVLSQEEMLRHILLFTTGSQKHKSQGSVKNEL